MRLIDQIINPCIMRIVAYEMLNRKQASWDKGITLNYFYPYLDKLLEEINSKEFKKSPYPLPFLYMGKLYRIHEVDKNYKLKFDDKVISFSQTNNFNDTKIWNKLDEETKYELITIDTKKDIAINTNAFLKWVRLENDNKIYEKEHEILFYLKEKYIIDKKQGFLKELYKNNK